MKFRKLFFILILCMIFVAACQEKEQTEINLLDPLEVELITNTPIEIDSEIVSKLVIKQKGEPVKEVSDVTFEIWQHGNPDSYEVKEGRQVETGVYEVNWTAANEGVYYVYYHVTANGLHWMEKLSYVVGDVNEDEIKATPDERPKKHMH